jgi:hypothetical protein
MVYLSVANLARGGHTDPPPIHTPILRHPGKNSGGGLGGQIAFPPPMADRDGWGPPGSSSLPEGDIGHQAEDVLPPALVVVMNRFQQPQENIQEMQQDHVPTQGSPSPSQERLPPQEQVPPQGTPPPPQERPPTQGSPSSVHAEAQGRVTVAPRSTTARVASGAEEKGLEFMRTSVLTTNARYRG